MYGGRADKGVITYLKDLGFDRVVLPLPPEPAEKNLPRLDKYANVIASLGN
jgi:hypothetical protein